MTRRLVASIRRWFIYVLDECGKAEYARRRAESK
jgi:hypothetical protein